MRIFSGVRPTGNIHIGNYFGAIKNWVSLSKTCDEHFFCVVDQHALTTQQDSANLIEDTLTITAAYIACGINPEKSHIFTQSYVHGHTELAWYLGCITPLGWLNRMTQFKDKAGANKEDAKLGLYAYPVLMSADILLYNATHVPVGEDQKQHVELARDIATAFNNRYKTSVFTLPEPIIQKDSARIMSLRDGLRKMGKSDISEYSRIHLLDTCEVIQNKIKRAKTDNDYLPGNIEGLQARPEAKNLLTLYALVTDQSLSKVCEEMKGQNFEFLKNKLSESLIAYLTPIRENMQKLLQDHSYLRAILRNGADFANHLANQNLANIREKLGLLFL